MKERILFVDDDYTLLDFFKEELGSFFDVTTAANGKEGLKILMNNLNDPFPVIVSDYDMPGMNGIQFLSEVRKISNHTTRIMITANTDIKIAVNAVSEGDVFRFLLKPCPPKELIKNIMAGIEQYRLVLSEKNILEKTLLGAIGVLIDILSVVNPEVFSQALRLRTLAKKIISRMKLANTWELEIGVLLSQIGCVSIPPEILKKKFNGYELTEAEKKVFHTHPTSGFKFLSRIPRLEKIAESIRYQYSIPDKSDPVTVQIVQLNKILQDYDVLIQTNHTPAQSLEIMDKERSRYDVLFFEALQAEILKVQEGHTIKLLNLNELKVGQVIADEVRSEKGLDLVKKGTEITEVILDRLIQFKKREPILEPIKIIEQFHANINNP